MRSRLFPRLALALLLLTIVAAAAAIVLRSEPTVAPAALPSVDDSLGRYFTDYDDATLVVYDGQTRKAVRYNPARASARFAPYSTFKIPLALIGLETFVIDDADEVFVYDSARYPQIWPDEFPYSEWGRNHTLRSAMQYSVNWYFQEVARQVEASVMDEWVQFINYGNADTSSDLTTFWMDGTLRISAFEQILFLEAFYKGSLPFRTDAAEPVRDVIVLEETDDYRLSGKTGTGMPEDGRWLGWLIGYFEVDEDVYYFAMNMEGAEMADQAGRVALIKEIMGDMGYLP